MANKFSINEVQSLYPEAVVDGKIDYQVLSLSLAEELSDIQDQLKEKDYQILRITERLDLLEC